MTALQAEEKKRLVGIFIALGLGALIALAGSDGGVQEGSMPLFALCALYILALHWVMFVPAYLYQTEHYFDLTGSLCYLGAVGIAVLLQSEVDLRGQAIAVLIALWAGRLGSFLFLRVKREGGDGRFDDIKPSFVRFLFAWTLSAAWVLITMAAGLAAITSLGSPPIGVFFYLGLGLWLGGFALEVTADQQKTRFRSQPGNRGRFIRHGVWAWSRHPNYFGEIILWLGIALMALPALGGWQWATLISPLFVALLLTRISGVNMLESRADAKWGSDPEYQKYKAQTPVLIPRPGRGRAD